MKNHNIAIINECNCNNGDRPGFIIGWRNLNNNNVRYTDDTVMMDDSENKLHYLLDMVVERKTTKKD